MLQQKGYSEPKVLVLLASKVQGIGFNPTNSEKYTLVNYRIPFLDRE